MLWILKIEKVNFQPNIFQFVVVVVENCIANKSFIFLRATNYSKCLTDLSTMQSMVWWLNKQKRNTIPIATYTKHTLRHTQDNTRQHNAWESKQSINLNKKSTTRPRSVIDITCQHDSHSTLIRINSYCFVFSPFCSNKYIFWK